MSTWAWLAVIRFAPCRSRQRSAPSHDHAVYATTVHTDGVCGISMFCKLRFPGAGFMKRFTLALFFYTDSDCPGGVKSDKRIV